MASAMPIGLEHYTPTAAAGQSRPPPDWGFMLWLTAVLPSAALHIYETVDHKSHEVAHVFEQVSAGHMPLMSWSTGFVALSVVATSLAMLSDCGHLAEMAHRGAAEVRKGGRRVRALLRLAGWKVMAACRAASETVRAGVSAARRWWPEF